MWGIVVLSTTNQVQILELIFQAGAWLSSRISQFYMSNTIFEGNFCPAGGGAVLIGESNVVLENNQYLDNCSGLYGGAVALLNNLIASDVGSYYEGSTVNDLYWI